MCLAAFCNALFVARTVTRNHVDEFLPVDLAVLVMTGLRIEFEFVIGNLQTEKFGLRHRNVDELLAKFVIRKALDLPGHRLRRMLGVFVARTEHHQRRPPPAIKRILCHRFLCRSAITKRNQDVVALTLVKTLFFTDPDHCSRVGTVGTTAKRNLVHDCGTVDEPADRADVRPGKRGIVEDAGVLRLATQEISHHLSARDAERLGRTIEV